jgi:putative methyltransferase (TIGR04325 family)
MSTFLLNAIKRVDTGLRDIVDFGGGDAIAYREIVAELPKYINYVIVELPEVYNKYKDKYPNISWSLTIPKTTDIIYCNASLQYNNIWKILSEFINTNTKLIVLERTPIGEYETKSLIQPDITYGVDGIPGKTWMYNLYEVNDWMFEREFQLEFFEIYDTPRKNRHTKTPHLNFLRKRNNLIYSRSL